MGRDMGERRVGREDGREKGGWREVGLGCDGLKVHVPELTFVISVVNLLGNNVQDGKVGAGRRLWPRQKERRRQPGAWKCRE